MILHQDIKLLEQSIRATSQHFSIKETFVEKDYWISLVLSRLARSEKSDKMVFKGGTSLSKAYNLIERFSEDVDLAVVKVEDMMNIPEQIDPLFRNKLPPHSGKLTPGSKTAILAIYPPFLVKVFGRFCTFGVSLRARAY